METLMQDIRFALRTLAKAPMFTAMCVLCLSIGIGLNANIYSAVYAVFQRPFEYADPERLVWIAERHERRGWTEVSPAYETFRDIQRLTPAIEQAGAINRRSLTITEGEEPLRMQGALISWNLFPLLGVQPILGRTFRPDEDAKGAPGTIILSHGIWETRYASDSTVVGRSISINGSPHTVIGVMPQGFRFPELEQAWVTIAPTLEGHPRDWREVSIVGRLKPGVDVQTANTQLTSLSRRLETEYPREYESWRSYAVPLRDAFIDTETKLVIATMMGAVTFVLLIACANVANLLLARATTRGREVAVRAALGAGRRRIIRQLLTESVLLGLIAFPIGVAIAYWLLDIIIASIPEGDLPYYYVFKINGPVLLYTAAIAVGTGLVFGLAPALQAVRGNLQSALKDGARGAGMGGGKNRLRTSFAVAQIALSMVLLIGAALFVRSFMNLRGKTGGIESSHLLTMRFFMPGTRYDSAGPVAARVEDVLRRVEALPGVVSAASSNLIPLSGGGAGWQLEIEGKPVASASEAIGVFWTGVTAHWFSTLKVPFLAGRDFTEQEARDSARVAVINETMAKRFWPEADPIGRRFRNLRDTTGAWFTVIGVTRDFKDDDLDDNEAMDPSFYLPYRHLWVRNTGLLVRTQGDPAQLTSAVRKAIRDSDPTLPVFAVATMDQVRQDGMWAQRLFGWMFAMFGLVALVLASVGVYGVIAYGVSQRTQEIGVRVALGAQPADVLRLVVRNGAVLAVSGIGIGLIGAYGLTRIIQSLLVDVSSTDVISFVGVTLFLGAVALFASYVPARRATRVDPLTALRYE
jgi:putative ABC transport system permease protein